MDVWIFAIVFSVLLIVARFVDAANREKAEKGKLSQFPTPLCKNVSASLPVSPNESEEHEDDTAFLTDQYEVTGYKILYRFSLAGACYQSERGKELSRSLHAGDPVQLVPEPYNPKDRYAIAVHVAGERIGYVQTGVAGRIYDKIFSGYNANYLTCQVMYKELNPGYDTPKMMLTVFVKDENGTDSLLSDRIEPEYIYVEPIEGCGVDHIYDILHRGYLMISDAKQIIYSHPEWYAHITTDEQEEVKNEDDGFFIDFVRRLYGGGIVYDTDVEDYIKSIRDERTVGTSRVLGRRIRHYLSVRDVTLA